MGYKKNKNEYKRLSPGFTPKEPGEWMPIPKSRKKRLKELRTRIFHEVGYLLRLLKRKGFE
jgi:hypothetical protein